MKDFDVQSVRLNVSRDRAFAFIADPNRLPQWAHAFASVHGSQALMRTPKGEVTIGLNVRAVAEAGSIDWHMSFPDGSIGRRLKCST